MSKETDFNVGDRVMLLDVPIDVPRHQGETPTAARLASILKRLELTPGDEGTVLGQARFGGDGVWVRFDKCKKPGREVFIIHSKLKKMKAAEVVRGTTHIIMSYYYAVVHDERRGRYYLMDKYENVLDRADSIEKLVEKTKDGAGILCFATPETLDVYGTVD
jgi:hypothetical protein